MHTNHNALKPQVDPVGQTDRTGILDKTIKKYNRIIIHTIIIIGSTESDRQKNARSQGKVRSIETKGYGRERCHVVGLERQQREEGMGYVVHATIPLECYGDT